MWKCVAESVFLPAVCTRSAGAAGWPSVCQRSLLQQPGRPSLLQHESSSAPQTHGATGSLRVRCRQVQQCCSKVSRSSHKNIVHISFNSFCIITTKKYIIYFSGPEVRTLKRIQLHCTARSTNPDKHSRRCIYVLKCLWFFYSKMFKNCFTKFIHSTVFILCFTWSGSPVLNIEYTVFSIYMSFLNTFYSIIIFLIMHSYLFSNKEYKNKTHCSTPKYP